MNNLSKLQSEAVLEFDELWVILTSRKLVSEKPHTKADIKQFLSDQIQKAVEETRKDIIADVNLALINSRRMVQSPTGDFDVLDPKFLEEQLLSIQSKGKMK